MRNMLEMVGCSRLPGSHGLVAWKTSDNSNTVQTVHLIAVVVSGLYLEACIRGGTRS